MTLRSAQSTLLQQNGGSISATGDLVLDYGTDAAGTHAIQLQVNNVETFAVDLNGTTTSTINLRARGASPNAKALMRLMPQGTGESSTTGDRAEFSLMGLDVDQANRWWTDMKVRERISDARRFFHILTDWAGTAKPIETAVIELDLSNFSGTTEEFLIVRDSPVDSATAAQTMFRVIKGSGVTHLDSDTLYLTNNAGNFLLGNAQAGDLVIHTAGSFRPFGDAATNLGASGLRWKQVWLTALIQSSVTITYSATMATDASQGDLFTITATNSTAFTISNPTNPTTGQTITYTIRNTSGGALGAATWGAGFKMAVWTQPANGFSRSISFKYNGTNWIEVSRTPADVAN